ncbi:MAG: acyl-[acyl-carrier-protein] thioesterase [Aureispira sp.]
MAVPEELLYEGPFTIRTSEVTRHRQATAASLINLMQEAALQNVLELNVSAWDMSAQQISWVLMRKHLEIVRMPSLGETITIQTYPAGFDKILTYRDYKVFDAQRNLIASSSSTWLLMHTVKRRIARIPAEIRERGQFDTSCCLPHARNKLPDLEQVDIEKDFVVNWHDMDFNEHLNNVRYMQWVFETIEGYTEHSQQLSNLDIIYKQECHWKDVVRVKTQKIDSQMYRHQLIRLSDEEEIARCETQWKKRLK